MDLAVEARPQGAVFSVKVQAGARRTAVAGCWNRALKLQIAAPAADGAANNACIAFLAEILKIGRRDLKIIRGEFSPHKVIRVSGLAADQVRERLAGFGKGDA